MTKDVMRKIVFATIVYLLSVNIVHTDSVNAKIISTPEIRKEKYEYMERLPKKVSDVIKDRRFYVFIVDDPNNHVDSSDGMPTAGVVSYSTGIIYIKENRMESALYHEIGHAYDYCMERISDTEEFKEIFEDEKENFHKYIKDDGYYTANTHEYFAETFEEYVKENENLKNYLPRTYSFIKKNTSYPDPKPTKKNKKTGKKQK